jgi:DivIVA domain-containing protein
MAGITAAELRATRIGRPSIGKRGYHPEQVDDFLGRAADALEARAAGRVPGLTADDVRDVLFAKPPFRSRGYDEDQVDDLLDAVAAALRGTTTAGIELNGRPLQP